MARGRKPSSVQIVAGSQSLTPAQAAAILQCHVRTVHRLLKSGRLRGSRLMREWRIHPDVLEAFRRGDMPPGRSDTSLEGNPGGQERETGSETVEPSKASRKRGARR